MEGQTTAIVMAKSFAKQPLR